MTELLSPPRTVIQHDWLRGVLDGLRSGRPQVLITVIRALGSTPRDAGARMWVDEKATSHTIGGGHLELQALTIARDMLKREAPFAQVVHYALGPSLGQCCGGAVWLAFEYLDPHDMAWLESLEEAVQTGEVVRRTLHIPPSIQTDQQARAADPAFGRVRARSITPVAVDIQLTGTVPDASRPAEPVVWDEQTGQLTDLMLPHRLHVVVCGAGHVGKAIIRLLGDLPVNVTWLDPRDDEWPVTIPSNVTCVQGDADDVIDCPDHAYWLVLTHSHALDLDIIEQVFRQKPFCFLGLIGSGTKNARFRSQLLRRHDKALVERMVCPIGLVETSSKLPSVIAVSVVAQLIPLIGSATDGRS